MSTRQASLMVTAFASLLAACSTTPSSDAPRSESACPTCTAAADHSLVTAERVEATFAPAEAVVVSSTWSPAERTRITQLESLYSTGHAPEEAKFLEKWTLDGKPIMPRDPGPVGLDGEELLGRPLPQTRFVGSSGDVVDLNDWRGKKNVVLVVLRGFSGTVCLSCTGQTLAMNQNLKAFAERDAEVFFVYPGPRDSVPKFLDSVCDLRGSRESLPIEILLDIDLKVVREFKIEGQLAKPTTIILDKAGVVRFAHVGQTNTDRPTVPAMLDALSQMAAARK